MHRRWERKSQTSALLMNIIVVPLTFWAAQSSARSAQVSRDAVSVARTAIERQSSKGRYIAGMQAIGEDLAVERMAGLTMLTRAVRARLEDAISGESEGRLPVPRRCPGVV